MESNGRIIIIRPDTVRLWRRQILWDSKKEVLVRTHRRSSTLPCKPKCEPDNQKHTKGIIRSHGELVSTWKEMVVVSFGTLSQCWPRKTKEYQENFQSGQPVSGTRTESWICKTWNRKGKNSTSACRWHPACFTVGLFQTDLARSGLCRY